MKSEKQRKHLERLVGINTGRQNSPEIIEKLKKAHRNMSTETRRKMSESAKGKIVSLETRRRMSESKRGDKSSLWRGGKNPNNDTIRRTLEYRLWRESVFLRDKFTCIWCGDSRGGNLNADHIKPFSLYPELRFAIDNGRTLCVSCHKKTDTWGSKVRNYVKKS